MSITCPSCGTEWPDGKEVCGDCLAYLVADRDDTIVCPHCQTVCPARMQACRNCFAELRVDPERAAEAMATLLVSGYRLPRPAGTPPFASGPNCSLLRVSARSSLIYTGESEFMEASVEGIDERAVPPLRCVDVDGSLLFRLVWYEALRNAVVAVDRDGEALGTFLRTEVYDPESDWTGIGLHVRDETSAPVATLKPSGRAHAVFHLVETGGDVLATCNRTDTDLDRAIDDQWSLHVKAELPLKTLAAVALLLAAKVFMGRPLPTPIRDKPDQWGDEADLSGRGNPLDWS